MTAADQARIAAHRQFFADLVTAPFKALAPALRDAFLNERREWFLGPGPWEIFAGGTYVRTPSDDPAFLYQDVLVRLKGDANNGQPTLHAACLAALSVRAGETVVHVGAGTGYYTAILSRLVGPSGHVHAYEIDDDLADRARRVLSDRLGVSVHAQSAIGRPLPGADVIYVNAGTTLLPNQWLDALRQGGRLFVPLTPAVGPGAMLLVTRNAVDCFDARFVIAAMFIPCVGARDEASGVRLGDSFRRGDAARVRSLRRRSQPDQSCWYAADGWWLSTESCPAAAQPRVPAAES
jgi:protein-L-isoaspartate(D-aspartate) O-methyltransferase